MVQHFADTSAILHQKHLLEQDIQIAISPITIQELEHIKNNENEILIKENQVLKELFSKAI